MLSSPQKANQTHNPINFRLLKLKRAKKSTNFTDPIGPIHESYIPNQDATSMETWSAKSAAQQREGESRERKAERESGGRQARERE
jgi:hypothetical protein